MRITPDVRLQETATSTADACTSPIRIPRSSSTRHFKRSRSRRDEDEASPSPSPRGSAGLSKGHVAVALAHSALELATNGSTSNYTSSCSEDEEDAEKTFLEGRGKDNDENLLSVDGINRRKESVSKSRSMVSLSSNSDPLNQSFTAITADQARTRQVYYILFFHAY